MILDMTGNGPLGIAIRRAIESGEEVRRARPGDAHSSNDLFMRALGSRAIVTAPAPNLLEGKLAPQPCSERMKTVLRAANAPGVQLLVLVVPAGEHYATEELILRQDGKPYVIVRCAPLVEELADAANFHVIGSLWLARGKTTAIARAADVARVVANALNEGSWQGRAVEVPSERVDLTEAARRAASVAGARIEVHATSSVVSAVHQKLTRWLGIEQPAATNLLERIASATA